jgi:virginiamycin A acetyltransferase
MLEKLKRRDKSIEEINSLIPILTSSDLEIVKNEIKKLLNS